VVEVDLRRLAGRQKLVGDAPHDPVVVVGILGGHVAPLAFEVAGEIIVGESAGRNQFRIAAAQPVARLRSRSAIRRLRICIVTAENALIADRRIVFRPVLIVHEGDRHTADRRLRQHFRLAAAAVVARHPLGQQSIGYRSQSQNQQQRENAQGKQESDAPLRPSIVDFDFLLHSAPQFIFIRDCSPRYTARENVYACSFRKLSLSAPVF